VAVLEQRASYAERCRGEVESELISLNERLNVAERRNREYEAEGAKGGLGEARARANVAEATALKLQGKMSELEGEKTSIEAEVKALRALTGGEGSSAGGGAEEALVESERRRLTVERENKEMDEKWREAERVKSQALELKQASEKEERRRKVSEEKAVMEQGRCKVAQTKAEAEWAAMKRNKEEVEMRLTKLQEKNTTLEMNTSVLRVQLAEAQRLENEAGESLKDAEKRISNLEVARKSASGVGGEVDAKMEAYNIPSLKEIEAGSKGAVPTWKEMEKMMKERRESGFNEDPPGGESMKMNALEEMNDRLRTELLMMSLMRLELTHLTKDKRDLEREVTYLHRELEMKGVDDSAALEMMLHAEKERDAAKRETLILTLILTVMGRSEMRRKGRHVVWRRWLRMRWR